MESNWRWNVAQVGLSTPPIFQFGEFEEITLVAELIPGQVGIPLGAKWLLQIFNAGVYTGTFGLPSLADPSQCVGIVDTAEGGSFPYGWLVLPD